MIVRDDDQDTWKKLEGNPPEKIQTSSDDPLDVVDHQSAAKRPRSRSSSQNDGPEPKKPRTSGPSCLAPAVNHVAQAIFDNPPSGSENATSNGTGDIFLTEGFRQRWCRCERVSTTTPSPYYSSEKNDFAVSAVLTGTSLFA